MIAALSLDVPHARQTLAHGLAVGLGTRAHSRRVGVPSVPDILLCTYDAEHQAFHIVYQDFSSEDLALAEFSDIGTRQVVAWGVDEARRGVEVVLDDGSTTSFSAEFPRYLHDGDYRRRVDARRAPSGQDLGERIAQRVRAERERRGWSIAELARHADMASPNVHRVEAGRHVPSMQTVVRLSAALGVPLERLLRARGG